MNQCWATAVGQDLNEWYVCVCVWERETERERERDCVLGVLLLKKKGRMIPASAYRRDWGETDISSLETIYKYKTKYMVQCISMLEMLEWLWWSEIALGALSKRGFLGRVLKKFGGPRLGPWRDCCDGMCEAHSFGLPYVLQNHPEERQVYLRGKGGVGYTGEIPKEPPKCWSGC